MSIRAYPPADTLEERFRASAYAGKPIELFYLISGVTDAVRLRGQLEAVARLGGAVVRFFSHIDQLLIGQGTQPWEYAAVVRFSSPRAAIEAARDDTAVIDADRIAIYPIAERLPPAPLRLAAGFLRPLGKLLDTGDADLGAQRFFSQRPDVVPTAQQLKERAADTRECAVYCINFLSYREKAMYRDARPTELSGVDAYLRYGVRGFAAVRALGGNAIFGGRSGEPLVDGGESAVSGDWSDIIIVRYPTPRAILKLSRIPWYNGGHVHRDAGIERTALLVASDVA